MSSFTPAGSGGVPQQIAFVGVANPTVLSVSLQNDSTEYDYTLPASTKQFLLRLRSPAALKLSYVPGTSSTNYITIPRNCFYAESDLSLTSPVTIYFQSPQAAQILEILIWS